MGLTYEAHYPVLTWTSVGDVDHAEGMEVVAASFETIRASGKAGWHILADLYRSDENRSSDELRTIAAAVGAQKGLLSGRIGIVAARPLIRGTSRMFAAYMDDYGVEVRIFSNVEDGLAWLVS